MTDSTAPGADHENVDEGISDDVTDTESPPISGRDRIDLLKRLEHPNEMLTMAEVAQYLQIPILTLKKWRVKKDDGPFRGPQARHIGRHLRYRAADVTAWVEALD